MFLTNKKKIKLLDFEERVIKTKGYYGEDLELRAIKNKLIGKYEILLPNNPAVLESHVYDGNILYKNAGPVIRFRLSLLSQYIKDSDILLLDYDKPISEKIK